MANLCFSFVVSSILCSQNTKFIFLSGVLWSSVTVGSFGILGDAPKGQMFFLSCLCCRICNGMGASMLYSTALPIAVQMYPQRAGVITSVIQTALGFGLCLGPPVGSLLLPLGGYRLPFLSASVIEFTIYIMGLIFIPSKGAKSETKMRASECIRFLIRPSSLSVLIPSALIFSVGGIRDSACSIYFEDVLGVDEVTVGYIFIANSAAYFLTGPVVGVLVEMGFGPFIALTSQLMLPLISIGFVIPMLVPALEIIPWATFILFGNGFLTATMMNPTYLLLEKVALMQGLTSMHTVKTIVASTYNMMTSSGGTFGAFAIGGFLNDKVGFYNMYLIFTGLVTVTATWNTCFLFKNNLVRRMFYDLPIEVQESIGSEHQNEMRLEASLSESKMQSGILDDAENLIATATPSIASMFVASMSRSYYVTR